MGSTYESTYEGGRGIHASWGRLALGIFLLGASTAHAEQSLGFFKNYFLTGDYVAAGVGLRGKGVNGIATGTITIDPSSDSGRRRNRRGVPLLGDARSEQRTGRRHACRRAVSEERHQRSRRARQSGRFPGLLQQARATIAMSATRAASGARSVYVYRSDVLPYFERITPSDPTQPMQRRGSGPARGLAAGCGLCTPPAVDAGCRLDRRLPRGGI